MPGLSFLITNSNHEMLYAFIRDSKVQRATGHMPKPYDTILAKYGGPSDFSTVSNKKSVSCKFLVCNTIGLGTSSEISNRSQNSVSLESS